MTKSNSNEFKATPVVDDLKLINGIGPAVEKRLRVAGILTYAQLAGMKPKKLAGLLRDLIGFTEKQAQDWIGQARRLVNEAEETFQEEEGANSYPRQPYAVYTVELLLDKDNQVRRTRAMYVQTQQEVTWTGWDEKKLQSFFINSAQLRVPESQKTEEEEFQAVVEVSEAALSAERKSGRSTPKLSGVPEIIETQLLTSKGERLRKIIPSEQPFDVSLLLDLSSVEIPDSEPLAYEAILYAKQLGSHERLTIGKDGGSIPPKEKAVISIRSEPLPAGDYRLEALITLGLASYPRRPENQLLAFMEGMRIHIY